MRILFVGDVVGKAGRRFLAPALRRARSEHAPDLIVVNGENAAGGVGITPATADELFAAGADVITTGNHIWQHKEIVPYLETTDRLLRPQNYPAPAPGRGICELTARDGTPAIVINMMGRVFMGDFDDPFRAVDSLLEQVADPTRVVLVDFHAEATSEKIAMGWYLDGRVSAVFGTHTHVATADARILPQGTAYVTDVGMTGPHDSVIGADKQEVLERFLSQRPVRLSAARNDVRMCGAFAEVDGATGRAVSVRRIELRENGGDESL